MATTRHSPKPTPTTTSVTVSATQLRMLQTLAHDHYMDAQARHDRLVSHAHLLKPNELRRSAQYLAEATELLELIYPTV